VKTALVTGITGQDGSYLAELLLAKGYRVHGVNLGNLDARRDWGFAGDHVDAMCRMLQQGGPDDFVIATGKSHSIRDLPGVAFGHVGLEWRDFVAFDPRYVRPSEADPLEGDASKARKLLGWRPTMSFEEMVVAMVEHDLQLAARERMLADHGHHAPARGSASP
jgi:GDPmannose 4,6-dehydratase